MNYLQKYNKKMCSHVKLVTVLVSLRIRRQSKGARSEAKVLLKRVSRRKVSNVDTDIRKSHQVTLLVKKVRDMCQYHMHVDRTYLILY